MFAALRASFAVIVMLRMLFTVARDGLALLLYMVRFESAGSDCIYYDVCRCIINVLCCNSLPAPSYAVMLNVLSSPFGEFCKTVMFAYAVLFDSVMLVSVSKICRLHCRFAQIPLADVYQITIYSSLATVNNILSITITEALKETLQSWTLHT